MNKNLFELRECALKEIENARKPSEIAQLKSKYLGKKSKISEVMSSLKNLPIEERRETGKLCNAIKKQIAEAPRQRFVNAISNNGEYRNLPQLQQTTIEPQSAESIIKDNLGKEESER